MASKTYIPGFRPLPKTGVIYVMHEAAKEGYHPLDHEWANLGQGAPEAGALPGAPERITQLSIDPLHHEYAPVDGARELRQRVADYYNDLYRYDKRSQYTYENVSIASGGRAALTRLVAGMGDVNLGHFLPDYTAYEELLSAFRTFIPIPILLSAGNGFRISVHELEREILGRGLSALLASNPSNPTGQMVEGEALASWVQLARELDCTFILDEFYSHYIYTSTGSESPPIVSAARYIEDVNHDPVIIVDGLTKNWRYPGWRISWTVAPREVIDIVASAGSFLDGGASNPFQQQAMALLEPEIVLQETAAIQEQFRAKRDYMLSRLRDMGIIVDPEPVGGFYCWANLSTLPSPLSDALSFFRAGLEEKVITVPGLFFDVNPGKRRSNARYQSYARISFGPEMETLVRGLDGLERVIVKARRRQRVFLNGSASEK